MRRALRKRVKIAIFEIFFVSAAATFGLWYLLRPDAPSGPPRAWEPSSNPQTPVMDSNSKPRRASLGSSIHRSRHDYINDASRLAKMRSESVWKSLSHQTTVFFPAGVGDECYVLTRYNLSYTETVGGKILKRWSLRVFQHGIKWNRSVHAATLPGSLQKSLAMDYIELCKPLPPEARELLEEQHAFVYYYMEPHGMGPDAGFISEDGGAFVDLTPMSRRFYAYDKHHFLAAITSLEKTWMTSLKS